MSLLCISSIFLSYILQYSFYKLIFIYFIYFQFICALGGTIWHRAFIMICLYKNVKLKLNICFFYLNADSIDYFCSDFQTNILNLQIMEKFLFKVERQIKPLEPWKVVFEREAEMSVNNLGDVISSLKLLYASFAPIRVIVIVD